ncbi:hypothetical protein A1YU_03500 [Escherichia coli KTE142]|nr:hypothetical protein A1YU_03500 [Escherichia coli KTE142]
MLLFEDLALFNQKLAEYLVLYNSKRPHKALALMTPVEYILKENKNCNMWWTHTNKITIPDNDFVAHRGPKFSPLEGPAKPGFSGLLPYMYQPLPD